MPQTRQINLTVDKSGHGARLDLYLAKSLKEEGFSRERLKQLVLQEMVQVNGKVVPLPRAELREGDKIELCVPQNNEAAPEAEEGHLAVIWQDENVLVVNKPPGLTVHPCPSCTQNTLVNILLHHFPALANTPGLRPGIVHRLDKDTSGLLAIALDEGTRLKLSHSFAQREVGKKYLAIASGVFKQKTGEVNLPIARHPQNKTIMAVHPGGKEAVSLYKVLYQGKNFSLVEVEILTGRTHQIRVHLAAIGHPLWGDKVYGGPQAINPKAINKSTQTQPGTSTTPSFCTKENKMIKRQMLHSFKLSFSHPVTKEPLAFCCPPPEDFMQSLVNLSEQPLRVVITGLPGCGKSVLLKTLQGLGYPAFSADQSVKEEYAKGGSAQHLITARFAGKFNYENGEINRPMLFAAMRENPSLKNEVESIVHPIIEHRLGEFYEQHQDAELVFAEIPLYLEAGWVEGASATSESKKGLNKGSENATLNYSQFLPTSVSGGVSINDKAKGRNVLLVGVSCPQELRYKRLKGRGVSEDIAQTLDSWQWGEDKKMQACNVIIGNSGTLSELEAAAKELATMLAKARDAQNKALLEDIMGFMSLN